MKTLIDDVIKAMIQNRRRYGKPWIKVRLDRIEKLLPSGTDTPTFLAAFLQDPRIKLGQKADDTIDQLIPAVSLHFDEFTRKPVRI
jgi:hypothetical protein